MRQLEGRLRQIRSTISGLYQRNAQSTATCQILSSSEFVKTTMVTNGE